MTRPMTLVPVLPASKPRPWRPALTSAILALATLLSCPLLAATSPVAASPRAVGAVGFVDVTGPMPPPDCAVEEAALQSSHRLLERDSASARERRAELALENQSFVEGSSGPADLALAETNLAAERAEVQADRLAVDREERQLAGSTCDPLEATGESSLAQPAPTVDVVFEVAQQYLLPLERTLNTLPALVRVHLADPVSPQTEVAATGTVMAVTDESSAVIVRARLENPPETFRQGDVVAVALTLPNTDCAATVQAGTSPCR